VKRREKKGRGGESWGGGIFHINFQRVAFFTSWLIFLPPFFLLSDYLFFLILSFLNFSSYPFSLSLTYFLTIF
jgi:hypothetical protein